MNKESLERVKEKITEVLDNEDIPICDKVELLINLNHFLNPENYENNINVLKRSFDDERRNCSS